ncbi:MAG: hypothetical protein MJ119_05745 [Lachnospiraceae bacterium]|nr:hypothetical protein [Lachnospiraceae bacterium]
MDGRGTLGACSKKAINLWTASMVVWIFVIVYQVIVGLIALMVCYGGSMLLCAVWNIVVTIIMMSNIGKFKRNPPIMVSFSSNQKVTTIIFIFINLFLGGVLGVVGNILELVAIEYTLNHSREIYAECGLMPR